MQKVKISSDTPMQDEYDGLDVIKKGEEHLVALCINKYAYKLSITDAEALMNDLMQRLLDDPFEYLHED